MSQSGTHQTYIKHIKADGPAQHRMFLQRWSTSPVFGYLVEVLRRRVKPKGSFELFWGLSKLDGLGVYTAKNIVTTLVTAACTDDWNAIVVEPGAVAALEYLLFSVEAGRKDQGYWPWDPLSKARIYQAAIHDLAARMSHWLHASVKPQDAQEALCHFHKLHTGRNSW